MMYCWRGHKLDGHNRASNGKKAACRICKRRTQDRYQRREQIAEIKSRLDADFKQRVEQLGLVLDWSLKDDYPNPDTWSWRP